MVTASGRADLLGGEDRHTEDHEEHEQLLHDADGSSAMHPEAAKVDSRRETPRSVEAARVALICARAGYGLGDGCGRVDRRRGSGRGGAGGGGVDDLRAPPARASGANRWRSRHGGGAARGRFGRVATAADRRRLARSARAAGLNRRRSRTTNGWREGEIAAGAPQVPAAPAGARPDHGAQPVTTVQTRTSGWACARAVSAARAGRHAAAAARPRSAVAPSR